MGRLVHFEIQADDVARARDFYGGVFGWTFEDWSAVSGSEYWGIVTGPEDQPGINGGLLKRQDDRPKSMGANAFVGTVQVDDYDATERAILDRGGEVAVPKSAFVGMAWQGYYRDPEGNTFGLHQPDPEAK